MVEDSVSCTGKIELIERRACLAWVLRAGTALMQQHLNAAASGMEETWTFVYRNVICFLKPIFLLASVPARGRLDQRAKVPF